MRYIRIAKLFLALLLIGCFSTEAHAAVLSVVPSKTSVDIGEEVVVSVLLDALENVNAVQATLGFPATLVSYIADDRAKSVFNFWVEEPTVSGSQIGFTGGTPYGVTGTTLQVVNLKFKAKAAGSADFIFESGAVTANDGQGTDVLKEFKTGKVTIGSGGGKVPTPSSPGTGVSPSAATSELPLVPEVPRVVSRPVQATGKKPVAPILRVPLFPEEDRWYHDVGELTAFWDVPKDVTKVAVLLDKSPSTTPAVYEKELYDGKNMGEVGEGISYLHVRFQNSVGAGPVAHRKIRVDATSPLPFTIKSEDGAITQNPSPKLFFEASDELSGIDHYEVKIDSGDVLIVDEPELELPPQKPGKRVVVVTAVDKAGNTKEWFYTVEILPIQAPTVSPFDIEPYIGEGNFLVRGTALPNAILQAVIKSESGEVHGSGTVVTEVDGNWELVFNEPLKYGTYFVEVFAQDERGASSLPVVSENFTVRVRPLLVLGGIGITPNVFFAVAFLLIFSVIFLAWLSYYFWKRQVDRRVVIAQRDVTGAFENLATEVDTLLSLWGDGKLTKSELTTLHAKLKKIAESIARLKKYITQNVGGISR